MSNQLIIFFALIQFFWSSIAISADGTQDYLPVSFINVSASISPQSPVKSFVTLETKSFLKQSINNTGSNVTVTTVPKRSPCQCGNGVCGCCSRFLLETWKQKACVNVTYDPAEFSFTAKIWMNDRELYTRTVSGKNPRPVCIPVPRIPFMRACVRLYNIYFQGRNVHACLSMEGKFGDTSVFKVGLDCMRLGANGVALVRPEDGGGLGQLEFLPDDNSDGEDSDADYDDDDDNEDDDDDDDDY